MNNNRAQRQAAILNKLREQDRVSPQALAELFDVSLMTIHRDLKQLDEEGHITKLHGGATLTHRFAWSDKYRMRSYLQADAKAAIGAFAARYLINPDEDYLIIDSGSTTLAFAKALPDTSMNVMVSCLPALAALSEHQHTRVHSLGGQLNSDLMAFEGSIAIDTLKSCHFSKAFIGTDGIDLNAGFTTVNTANAQLTRLMTEQAEQVFVLADHTKFHQRAFASIMQFEHITAVVTDKVAPQAFRELFQKHNIQLYEVDSYHELKTD